MVARVLSLRRFSAEFALGTSALVGVPSISLLTLAKVDATRLFRSFLASNEGARAVLNGVDVERVSRVVFDYEAFCTALPPSLAGFPQVLRDNAATTLACLGLALCSLRRAPRGSAAKRDRLAPRLRPIAPRLVNYRPITRLTRLKADLIGKFVSIRGTVVRVCGVRPLVRRMEFCCSKCGSVVAKDLPDGKFDPPTSCESAGCRSKTFVPDRESAVTVDYQRIKLQEIIVDEDEPFERSVSAQHPSSHDRDESAPHGEDGDSALLVFTGSLAGEGRVPRTVNVELMDDLVDTCAPGDVVVVSGIVKAISNESLEGRGSRAKGHGREAGLLLLLVEANALENSRQTGQPPLVDEEHGAAVNAYNLVEVEDLTSTLTPADLRGVAEIASQPDALALLAYSICPSIYGHDHVKAGLLLGLLGGSSSPVAGTTKESVVATRADSHVLVVGDPGMGKSQMLRAAAAVAPRGVYVSGNTTSATGLTVTMSKDAHGEHSLEAGALVLADHGACCIDEFDKMAQQHAALLEAMEQQSISVAKAGVVCTLCARTSVLAAANPKTGTYRRDKTILENLSMGAPLLSRFDLVFLMIDRPDARRDELLASHVVDMHTAGPRGPSARGDLCRSASGDAEIIHNDGANSQSHAAFTSVGDDAHRPFCQRLAEAVARRREEGQPVPPTLLRKYVSYARKYAQPRLTLGACRVLQRFYLELRRRGASAESTPITTRQLESMMRLAQARARVELRESVTELDARDIVSLMEESLMDTLTDDRGLLDLGRAGGMSQSKVLKAFVEHLKRATHRRMSAFFTMDELRAEARVSGLSQQISDLGALLEKLSDHCYLLKKPNGYLVSRNVHGMSQQV